MENKKNSTKQISLEGHIEAIEKQLQTGFKGKITEINPITNKDYFGETGTYDVKEGWAVTVVTDTGVAETEFTQWFSKPSAQGYNQSNLCLFKKKYGSAPKVNLEVECYLDENGFFRIRY